MNLSGQLDLTNIDETFLQLTEDKLYYLHRVPDDVEGFPQRLAFRVKLPSGKKKHYISRGKLDWGNYFGGWHGTPVNRHDLSVKKDVEPICIQTEFMIIALLKKVPLELRHNIFDKTPLPFVADLLDGCDSKYVATLKNVCQQNNIRPKDGMDSNRGLALRSYLKSLKNLRLSGYNFWHLVDDRRVDLTAGKLYHLQHTNKKVHAGGDPRRLTFRVPLPQSRESLRLYVRDSEHIFSNNAGHWTFTLASRHDAEIKDNDQFCTTSFEIDPIVGSVAFDEENRVYYLKPHARHEADVYRQSLLDGSDAEFVWNFPHRMVTDLIVGNGKLLLSVVRNPPTIVCYDMETKSHFITECNYMGLAYQSVWKITVDGRASESPIIALRRRPQLEIWCAIAGSWKTLHHNTLVFSDAGYGTILGTINGESIQMQRVSSYRRQQLNRDTFLIMVEEEGEKRLKTLSIVEDQPIIQFVQRCEEPCAFNRLGDNFFYVLERERRHFWYQETPGGALCLVHADEEKSVIEMSRAYFKFKPQEQTCKAV
uniref:Dipeptidyl peptidase 8 n=1 Tax=Bursaphelenchus xylophilus TaxID=6326 RepID=A0A1I7SA37_BURXY